MSIVTEFREFAIKGNMVDMAVGIIIGGAFGKIVSSLVNDVLMPPIGMLLGGVKFSNLSLVLREEVGETPAIVFAYGKFLQQCFDFGIIALAVFMLVKIINRMRRKEESKAEVAAVPAGPTQEDLLAEIRDLLKERQ